MRAGFAASTNSRVKRETDSSGNNTDRISISSVPQSCHLPVLLPNPHNGISRILPGSFDARPYCGPSIRDQKRSALALPLVEAGREFAKRARRLRVSQFLQQALPVCRAPVLAKLEFTFKQLNLQFEADNPAHQAVLIAVVDFGEVVACTLITLEFGDQL